jgi:transposase-like protein
MNSATVRHKPIKCPHCRLEQRVHLLAIPDKPAVPVRKQTVRCVACDRGFYLLYDAKIVEGPFFV